ncbi:unnamed protein product [Clonostachys chloroleuca]|uniref:Water stress and hypersensitive response domain-containing protein n=1 Tax=Clonostachys chloroleuca TaxID=1926264 RepID=A0AA35LSD5_9HYPO|nr:unnamed protein product [Clonostachys chloroleuca]
MQVRKDSAHGSPRAFIFTFLALFLAFHPAMCRPGYGAIPKRDTASSSDQERGISPAATPGQSEAESPIPGLEVSLTQVKTSSSYPPVVTVTVTNRNSFAVTLLTYDSPVDRAALRLGIVLVTPEGAAGPLELPRIQFRRVWPPGPEQLVTLAPGGQTTSEIEFDDVVLDPAQLAGAKVVVKGRWKAVWKMVKEDIGQASLDDPDGNPGAFQGEFQSDELELVV